MGLRIESGHKGLCGIAACLMVWMGVACRPEMPIISSITIKADGLSIPVNPDLYGLTIEEINHGIEGGLYAELIQNRSFEEGVPPLNCRYEPGRNVLVTPNGWSIPFVRRDSIRGWHKLSVHTQLYLDPLELMNDKNKRSLLVSMVASSELGRGGVVAEGYHGFALEKGKRYQLSFYAKGANLVPRNIRVALEDSSATHLLSDIYELSPLNEWRRYEHTFTATADASHAVLTLSADTTTSFWLDVVSLFPEQTWKGRPNGLRPDLAALVDSLAPRFIRFPGGNFVEGYTAGTFPQWRETVGDIAERRHFWNVWGYGSTNGMGYHEYLQFCEDLGAEPVYVVNSGVTSQSRRPRYEDITAMDRLVKETLDAIAYANLPTDSLLGSMRAKSGHPAPFGLKYIEIGSENYGSEYARRFALFQKAIKEAYPDVTVISSSNSAKRLRSEWVDAHYYANSDFFLSNSDRFGSDRYSRRLPAVFIGEFGTIAGGWEGSLRAAIAEACFLIGLEKNPEMVRRLAYAPVFGHAAYEQVRTPLISFTTNKAIVSPSYHLFKMFSQHRGDDMVKTVVDTYERPQAYTGRAGLFMFDNSYEFKETEVDGSPVKEIEVLSGGWKLPEPGVLVPIPNRWNRVLFGDSARYTYEYSTLVRRTKGSGQVQFRLRDNGREGEQGDFISMTIGPTGSELIRHVGGVKDTLSGFAGMTFESNRWYKVRLACTNEKIRCYVDDALVHAVDLRPIPSLVAVATIDREQGLILLKVVNTTQHEEKTALHIEGATVRDEVELIQLAGAPEARNTFEQPLAVTPHTEHVSFSMGGGMVYSFPPCSVTIMKMKID